MVNFPGRNSRRRRVLNEEVLSASSSQVNLRAVADEGTLQPAHRYSDAASVENHPQITDFVPRRYRSIVLLMSMGLASVVALAALHCVAPSFALWPGSEAPAVLGMAAFDLAAPASMASWVAAVVLLIASALCLLTYSIRRHRIDDFRGRYRIWLAAAAACLILSANSVAGMHHFLVSALSHLAGWTALRDGAVWWLALAGLPLAWIALRALLDVAECRLAVSLLVAAVGCYVAAVVSYLGFTSAYLEPSSETILVGVAPLCGHWLLLTAVVSYARFIILDAQGLIPAHTVSRKHRAREKKSTHGPSAAVSSASVLSTSGNTRQNESPASPAHSPAATNEWVDGSQPEREVYEDDDDSYGGSRKLSKADRKRLRKLKAQNRAA